MSAPEVEFADLTDFILRITEEFGKRDTSKTFANTIQQIVG